MPGPFSQRAVYGLVNVDDGGWSEPQFPKFTPTADGRYTLGCTVSGIDGDSMFFAFDGATDTVDTTVLHAALGGVDGNPDMHDNGAVVVRPDGKVLCAYTAHADSVIRLRLSNESIDTTSPLALTFGTEYTVDPAVGVHDYPALIYLGTTLYLLWRNIPSGSVDAHLKYVTSTDDGDTFGSATDLWNEPGNTSYWSLAVNPAGDRIHVLTFDDNEGAVTNNLLKHFSFNATTRYQSDGSTIAATLPLAAADVDTITSTGGHHLFCLEVGYDDRVGFVCPRRVSGVHGVIRGILDAGAWTVEEIGANLSTPNYAWGTVIDPFDFDHALICRWSDASTADIWDYSKRTGSWVGQNITEPLAGRSHWAIFNRARAQGVVALFLRGFYTDSQDFTFDIYTLRRLT